MAEQGTVVQEQDKTGEAGQDGFSESEFNKEFDSAMAGEEKPAGEPEKKVAEGADGKPAGDDTGNGQKPPEKPATGDQAAADATAKAEQESAFLKGLGFDDAEVKEVTPKELARLHRLHDTRLAPLEGKVKFYGESNQKLSGQYRDAKKALSEIQAQQSPADKAKGIFSKIDMTKLSDGAKRILTDPEMQEVLGVVMSGMVPSAAGEEQPEAPQRPMTPEQKQDFDAKVSEISGTLEKGWSAAGHGDFEKTLGAAEFQAWFNKMPIEYRALLLRPFDENGQIDTSRGAKVFQDYRMHRTAIEADRQAKEEATRKNDALRTHGGGTGVTQADDNWKDPTDMTDAEFQAYEAKIAASRVRTG